MCIRLLSKVYGQQIIKRFFSSTLKRTHNVELPKRADVVIIGGGSAGCNTLYQLSKRNVKAVLLERNKITCGTTWHTAGLIRSLQASDVDIALLNTTRNVIKGLEDETEIHPGWINNGSLFIIRTQEREKDYIRQSTLGKYFNIKSDILSSKEITKIFPLLDENSYESALYCPEDGVIDPAMLCNALNKASSNNGGKIFEDCPVTEIQTEIVNGKRKVAGVFTPSGLIETKCIVNCTGAWANDLTKGLNLNLPLISAKHSYVVTNSMKSIRGVPNLRDQDASIYMRIQGESICLGGYEYNPEILSNAPDNFYFGLYELNWEVFESLMKGAIKLCPKLEDIGIKTTICGPESFTPDHKPIMGEDPRLIGLYHNCAFNSAGMMLGGGCAEQIALWILQGRPDLPMFGFDIRRFLPKMLSDRDWITEKTHECYAKYYNTQFPLDDSLAGRNLFQSPFHEELIKAGAFMEQKSGWERPRYFQDDNKSVIPEKYRWYGAYGNTSEKSSYEIELEKECTYSYPESQNLVRNEALACRNGVGLIDLSYYCKFYVHGKDAQQYIDWVFSGNIKQKYGKTSYTCALNDKGGVEADVTITSLKTDPFESIKEPGFYVVAGGATANYTWSHLNKCLETNKFNVQISDLTNDLGILSIQGPKSSHLLSNLTDEINNLSLYESKIVHLKDAPCLIMRISFVGELGYEIHIPKQHCGSIYQQITQIGHKYDFKHVGFRAMYALSAEKGYHLWNIDLRTNDNPIEANLSFTCRKDGEYIGKNEIDKIKRLGVHKKIAYFTLDCDQPLWGLETIWKNGERVGYLARGDYAFSLDCNIGIGYVKHPKGENFTEDYLLNGDYEIEVMGKRYKAKIHKRSPYDPENKRMLNMQ